MIAVAASVVYFSSSGLIRSSGVVYIALIRAYGVTREEASWPLSLSDVVMCLIGPVAGFLSHKFTIRSILLVGSVISCVGMCLCYFGTSIHYLAVCLGIIHGLGVGLNITLVPVIINQYFLRHRSTASGISFAGSSVGSFVFPYLMEYLFFKYGLKGGFLLLGGTIMHGIIGAALLRPPEWILKPSHDTDKTSKCSEEQPVKQSKSLPLIIGDEEDMKKGSCDTNHCDEGICLGEKGISDGISTPSISKECNQLSVEGTLLSKEMTISLQRIPSLEEQSTTPLDAKEPSPVPLKKIKDKRLPRWKIPSLHLVAPVFNRPICYILYFTHLAFFTAYYTYLMIVIDFAVDCGVVHEDAIAIISAFSAADLVGRLSSGWVTDKGFVSRKNLTIVSLILEGSIIASMPLVTNYSGMLAMAVCLGIVIGTTLSPIHIIIAEYLGLENMGLAIGVSYFIYGLFTFCKPLMIGYFRDTHGSYDYLFLFLGLVAIGSAFLWILEPIFKEKETQEVEAEKRRLSQDTC